MIEQAITQALAPLVDGRVFPDVAPLGTERPYIVYQQVGGEDASTFDGACATENARMQIAVWADARMTASAVARLARAALTPPPLSGVPLGAPVSHHEADTGLYGAVADFSIWFNLQQKSS